MAHPIAHTYKPKRDSKMPHRRATIDTPIGASSLRPSIKPSFRRGFSLPTGKSIQFSQVAQVRVFKLLPQKTNSCWYTSEDYARFKRERKSDIQNFQRWQSKKKMPSAADGSASRSPPITSIDASCPVGIEQLLSTKGLLEAYSSRRTVIEQVLLEQDRQRRVRFQNPLLIAIVSARLSADALEGAMKRGKFQEMAKFIES